MDKVWFKLRQTDYPPPTEESLGTDTDTAPISLGHFIADLAHLDFVLNRGKSEPFPTSMNVFQTSTLQFRWDDSQDLQTGVSGSVGAEAGVGIAVKGSIQVAFRSAVQNYEEYDRLDTYIVQPSKAYVAECLDGEQLAAHVAGKWRWKMFMVTGIKVARKGRKVIAESRWNNGEGGPEIDVSPIASANANLKIVRGKSQTMDGSHALDFVWAIRLAKVYKGLLMTDWSLGPYTMRATFGVGDEEVNVADTVAAEGLDKFIVIEDEELEEAFVVEGDVRSGEEEGVNVEECREVILD